MKPLPIAKRFVGKKYHVVYRPWRYRVLFDRETVRTIACLLVAAAVCLAVFVVILTRIHRHEKQIIETAKKLQIR